MPKIKLNDLDYGGSPTVEDADHLMVTDTRNQTLSAQNIITNILGDMAQLEHNATASKAYAKGEYLVLGSYFYKATADIAQGDTLVAGTNIEQTNVGAEVSELNSDATFTLGDPVNITSYTSSNPYTVPSDGYVHVYANNVNSNIGLYIKISGGSIATQVTGSAAHMTMFVKKGLQLWGSGENNGGLKFYPLQKV